MKTLTEYINESKKDEAIAKNIANMFSGTKISKELAIKMLSNVDVEILRYVSDYFYLTDSRNYIVYQPADDLFTESNKENIISQISDYIIKYIAN